MIRYFPAIVEQSTDDYGVFFPDVAGCVSAGDTIDQAVQNAEEALQAHLNLGAEHDDPLPEPSDLTRVTAEPDVVEFARVLVHAEVGINYRPPAEPRAPVA